MIVPFRLAVAWPAVLLIQSAVVVAGWSYVGDVTEQVARAVLGVFEHLFMAVGVVAMVFMFIDGGWRTVCRMLGPTCAGMRSSLRCSASTNGGSAA